MAADTLVQLDPSKVQADDNIRYNLKTYRVKALAESILAAGQVNVPTLVVALPKGSANGYTHRLVAGFYRHAAVTLLNTESKAGLKLPAIVRTVGDDVERLKLQVSENNERENLSPIDQATAARKLLDAGVSRKDVLAIFSRPGGRKGVVLVPASNAWLNMTLSFLAMPKDVQAKIHDGRVGVAAAYELSRFPEEKRAAILERAEKERQATMDREEKDEEKALKSAETEEQKAAKAAEATAKVEAAAKAKDEADTALAAANEKHNTLTQALAAARKTPENFLDFKEEEKKAFAEKIGAAKTDLRGAEKDVAAARIAADKAMRAHKALTEPKVKAKAEPVEGETVAPKKAKTAVGPTDIKKAARAEGAKTKKVSPLTIQEAKEAVGKLARSKTRKVATIGEILGMLLGGTITVEAAAESLALVK